MIKILGLTGGSGGGKGTVCDILKKYGAYVIDTDSLAHAVILKGEPAYHEILESFGGGILDGGGEIVRRRLSEIVFNDKEKLDRLTKITHKYIIERSEAEIAAVRSEPNGFEFIVIDAPLLIEANMHTICDEVWAVCADREKRVERIAARDGISREQAEKRVDKQTPLETLRRYADSLIENNGTVSELEKEVTRYLNCFMPSHSNK